MSLYPEDDDTRPTEIEKINEDFQAEQSKKSAGNQSGAGNSKITHPDEDAKKLERLRLLIQQEVDESMKTLAQQIPNIVTNVIQQLQQQAMQSQPQNQSTQPGANMLNDMPPEVKAEALSKIGTSIAQVIQAWKSNSAQPTQNDIYGEMFKQMGLDIVQAGLDGIKQQIYPQFVPQPRQNPIVPGATQPQGNLTTGFR